MGQTKICRGCGLSKPTSDFYKSRGRCKVCISKQGKQRYNQNKEKILKKAAEYREAHREEINCYFRERYKNNRKEILEKQKEYASEHREEKKQYLKDYYRKNKKRLAKQNYERQRERTKNDSTYKLKRQIGLLIWRSFNQKECIKPVRSEKILGCTRDFFVKYLKQTWLDEYGVEWTGQPCHIDHIVPLATAHTAEDVYRLCHYTNLRLLTPEDNMEKSDSLDYAISNNLITKGADGDTD